MKSKLARKDLIKTLLIISFVYLLLQIFLILINDKNLSRYFWLEHRNTKELIDARIPEKSGLTSTVKIISDNHFWLLRACVIATLVLTFYYKDKNEDLFHLFKNITISVVLILIIASGIVTWLLKIIVGKPRPSTKLDVYSAFNTSTKYYSFPSGHTSETFSYIIPYMYFLRKYYIIIILSLYGFLAAFTRVILAYHYFTDILFSIYITTLIGSIVCYIIENRKAQGASA